MEAVTLPWITFLEHIVPLIAAQFFLMFLVYISAMRKRMPTEYPYYAAFLGAMILFLGGNALPLLPIEIDIHESTILHIRMWCLFGIGCPALIVASGLHAGFALSRPQKVATFGAGLLLASLYVVILNIAWSVEYHDTRLWFGDRFIDSDIDFFYAHLVQVVAASLLLMLPSLFLLKRSWRKDSRATAVSVGILLFGGFMILGTLTKAWWIYYSGSFLSALIWGGAVYLDLNELKGKSALMKEELLLLVSHLNVSRSFLMSAFKQSEGMTVNQYLTQLRIERAKLLLATKSVTETAFEVGYNNSNYFSTVFKKATDTTPTQYQERIN